MNLKETVSAFNNSYIRRESIGDKDKSLSDREYIDIIRAHLLDLINNHKTQGEWKIHLTMTIIFFSKDSNETRTIHTKNDNIEIMMDSEKDEIVENFFESPL